MLTGNEIILERAYEQTKEPPQGDYKNVYPISVYEAIWDQVGSDEHTETLKDRLRLIDLELDKRQRIFPAIPANYLVTYGGDVGQIGSIEIVTDIRAALDEESDRKIPTEKAVGNLLRKFGLLTNEGQPGDGVLNVVWDAIIDRPTIYQNLNDPDDEHGVVSQAALKYLFSKLQSTVDGILDDNLDGRLEYHENRKDNPHEVTLEQLGGVSAKDLTVHIERRDNPHEVTREQLNLGNVDNTSDEDKPISKAEKVELDALKAQLAALTGSFNGLRYITSLEYQQKSGNLMYTLSDQSTDSVRIVTDSLIQTVEIDRTAQELRFTTLGGSVTAIKFSDMFIGYTGSDIGDVDIEIDGNNNIVANLKENAVKHMHIAPGAVEEDSIHDDAVTTTKMADGAVTSDKIKDGAIKTIDISDSAVTTDKLADGSVTHDKLGLLAVHSENVGVEQILPSSLMTSEEDGAVIGITKSHAIPTWTKVTNKMIGPESIDTTQLQADSVHQRNIHDGAIRSRHIQPDVVLDHPALKEDPHDGDEMEIPNLKWVRSNIESHKYGTDSLANRAVTGAKLFTSENGNEVLAVIEPNSDPQWTKIQDGMIGENAINSENLKENSVTKGKVGIDAIVGENIEIGSVSGDRITDNTLPTNKLIASVDDTGKVLGVTAEDEGHPHFTHITSEMIGKNVVGEENLKDGSVTLNKLEHPKDMTNVAILWDEEKTLPHFGPVEGKYIKDHSIGPEKLFTDPTGDKVIGVLEGNTNPEYMKITTSMLADTFKLTGKNIDQQTITMDKIAHNSITSAKIRTDAIRTRHIQDGTITGSKLFVPEDDQRCVVLGIPKEGGPAVYSKISDEYIADKSITASKLFTSDIDHSIIGVEDVGENPKYLKITSEYIQDGSLTSKNFGENIRFPGKPEVGQHPDKDSDSTEIASTAWVRQLLFDAGIPMPNHPEDGEIPEPSLQEKTVPVENLTPGETDNMVLSVLKHEENVRFSKIMSEMIDDSFTMSGEKILDNTITGEKLTTHTVGSKHLKDNSIGNRHLKDDLRLPVGTTVTVSDWAEPHVRDIYIGRELPTESKPGTIFLVYE